MTSVNAWLEEYLEWLTIERGRSAATLEAYRRDIEAMLRWCDEHSIKVASIDTDGLETYVGELRAGEQAASSVARAVAALRGWFAFLVDEGHLQADPSSQLKGGRKGRTLPKPLAEKDVIKLLDSVPRAQPADLRDRAILELLYDTGARVSEVVGLTLSDLDFDEELILVTGKGSKQRLVPMGETLKNVLLEYLGVGGRSSLLGVRRNERVLLNARGGALTRQGIDLIVHKRAQAAGLTRASVSAHVFRHSCATHMLAHGADIRVVQELLGHASIATTQLYTAVSVTTLQREYQNAHPRARD